MKLFASIGAWRKKIVCCWVQAIDNELKGFWQRAKESEKPVVGWAIATATPEYYKNAIVMYDSTVGVRL